MFKKLLIIGTGNQVFDIIQYCKKNNIELNIIAGIRQKSSNLLEKKVYEKIKLIKFKQIEYVSQLKYSKIYYKFIKGEFDYVLSIGSPFIFNKKIISIYKNRLINSHSSPLPQYKGGGGLTWRYLNQDTRGTILYHYVNKKIDEGLIIYKHNFKFPKNKKMIDWVKIQLKQEKKGINNILKILNKKNSIKPRRHPKNLSTYFPRINTDMNGYINFSWNGSYISRFINAFSFPYNGAISFVNNNKVRFFNSSFISKKNFNNHPFLNGIVFDISRDYLFVFVDGGYLKIDSHNYVSKYKIKLGDRIYTPLKFLDKSYAIRVSYSAKGLK